MVQQSKYAVKSVVKALNILDLLGQDGGGQSLTAMSKKLNISKSTISRLLSTLEACSFVKRDTSSQKYSLGIKILELGTLLTNQMMVLKVAQPLMEKLADKSGETVNLAVLEENEVLYVGKKDSPEPLRISVEVGRRVPAHCAALGKVLLADLSDEELSELFQNKVRLKRMTDNSITNFMELKAHLEKVRSEGLGSDYEECIPGIRCIAAPIRDFSGNVIAAVSISGPAIRMSKEKMDSLSSILLETANPISRGLGYKMSWEE